MYFEIFYVFSELFSSFFRAKTSSYDKVLGALIASHSVLFSYKDIGSLIRIYSFIIPNICTANQNKFLAYFIFKALNRRLIPYVHQCVMQSKISMQRGKICLFYFKTINLRILWIYELLFRNFFVSDTYLDLSLEIQHISIVNEFN